MEYACEVVFFVLVVIGVLVFVLVVKSLFLDQAGKHYEKLDRHLQRLLAAAPARGYEFFEQLPPDLPHLAHLANFAEFAHNPVSEIEYVLRIHQEGISIDFARVRETHGPDEKTGPANYHLCTIFVAGAAVPNFVCKCGRPWTKELFNRFVGIKFRGFGKFNHRCALRAEDRATIRSLFTPDVLNYLAELPYLTVEVRDNVLGVYCRGIESAITDLPSFIGQCCYIHDLLSAANGTVASSFWASEMAAVSQLTADDWTTTGHRRLSDFTHEPVIPSPTQYLEQLEQKDDKQ